jgi:hypothetical protein
MGYQKCASRSSHCERAAGFEVGDWGWKCGWMHVSFGSMSGGGSESDGDYGGGGGGGDHDVVVSGGGRGENRARPRAAGLVSVQQIATLFYDIEIRNRQRSKVYIAIHTPYHLRVAVSQTLIGRHLTLMVCARIETAGPPSDRKMVDTMETAILFKRFMYPWIISHLRESRHVSGIAPLLLKLSPDQDAAAHPRCRTCDSSNPRHSFS